MVDRVPRVKLLDAPVVRAGCPSSNLVALLQVFVMQGSWMWLVGQSLLVVAVHGGLPDSCAGEPLLSTCGLGAIDAVALALGTDAAAQAADKLLFWNARHANEHTQLTCQSKIFHEWRALASPL